MNVDVHIFLKFVVIFLEFFELFYVAFYAYRPRPIRLSARRVGGRDRDCKPWGGRPRRQSLRRTTTGAHGRGDDDDEERKTRSGFCFFSSFLSCRAHDDVDSVVTRMRLGRDSEATRPSRAELFWDSTDSAPSQSKT